MAICKMLQGTVCSYKVIDYQFRDIVHCTNTLKLPVATYNMLHGFCEKLRFKRYTLEIKHTIKYVYMQHLCDYFLCLLNFLCIYKQIVKYDL